MKGSKITELLDKIGFMARQKSPAILAGTAIVGVVLTAYAAYKAGPVAEKILKDYRKDMEDCHSNDKDAKRAVVGETVKKLVPVVAPTIVMGGATIACIAGSQSISNRRMAALSAAYTLSETTVKNLNGKMEEMLGEKKTRAVKDAIMKDKLKADSEKDRKILEDGQFVIPGDGTVLCKDLYSGRLFYSSAEKIKQAIAKCSYDIISDMYISLNEFYEAINSPQLPPIPLGEDLGWNVDDTVNGKLPIELTALLTDDGKPCLCMDYNISIRSDFRSLR